MDNITHTLAGLAMARAGLGARTRGATAALLVASNIPDIDLVTALTGPASYLEHHRGISHSVLGAPILALAVAATTFVLVKGSRFGWLFACALLGVGGHVFMDLWTSYGTRVLDPFDGTWYTWDLTFIIDPLILAVLLLSLLLARAPAMRRRLATLALGLVLAYVGARAVLHSMAVAEASARIPPTGRGRVAALPYPLDPLRWRIVADAGGAYWLGEVRLGGHSAPFERREKRAEDATVALARHASHVASIFLDFSRFPWLEVEATPAGTLVTWTDLRFERRGQERFKTRIVVGPDGRIRSEAFRF